MDRQTGWLLSFWERIDSLHLAVERIPKEGKQVFVFFHLLFRCLLLLLRLQAEIVGGHGAELLVVVLHHDAQGKLIDVVGEIKDLIAFFLEGFRLRQQIDALDRFSAA